MAVKKKKPRGIKVSHGHDVFISHASQDKWVALKICQSLESHGITYFRDDRDIKGGEVIPDEIVKAITRCSEVIVLLTPQSLNRTWVLLEVGMAIGRSKRVVPVAYHVGFDLIPEMIQSVRGYELNDADRCVREIADRIRKKKK